MPHTTKLTPDQINECKTLRSLYFREKDRSKMTHATLAKMIGMSTQSVTAMINGKMRIKLETGQKLAEVFGVDLVELLPWTGKLNINSQQAEVMDILEKLDAENLEVALRMIRALSESQA